MLRDSTRQRSVGDVYPRMSAKTTTIMIKTGVLEKRTQASHSPVRISLNTAFRSNSVLSVSVKRGTV